MAGIAQAYDRAFSVGTLRKPRFRPRPDRCRHFTSGTHREDNQRGRSGLGGAGTEQAIIGEVGKRKPGDIKFAGGPETLHQRIAKTDGIPAALVVFVNYDDG